ncbi:MAG: hypothetical protein AAGB24_10145 [Bacteroidota bacterium]
MKDTTEIRRLWNNPKLVFHDYQEKLDHFDEEVIHTKERKLKPLFYQVAFFKVGVH